MGIPRDALRRSSHDRRRARGMTGRFAHLGYVRLFLVGFGCSAPAWANTPPPALQGRPAKEPWTTTSTSLDSRAPHRSSA